MAKVFVTFKEKDGGETITGDYPDPQMMMSVIRMCVYGVTVEKITIEM